MNVAIKLQRGPFSVLLGLLWASTLLVPCSNLQAAQPTGWEDLGMYGGQINVIAIDPVDTALMFSGSYEGDGLFKSVDGGTTWQSMEGFRNQIVYGISFDPRNHTIMWVATWVGIYKSQDDGATWMRFDPARNSSDLGYYESLAIDPVNSGTVYVGTSGRNGSNDIASVYKTTDGGATWQQTSLTADHNVVDLMVNAGNPQEIWAVTGPDRVDVGSIYRSGDGGATWVEVDTGLLPGWFYLVRIDPRDSRTVFVGGENGLYRSRDGGFTWSQVIFVWCRAFAFDPLTPNRVYAHAGNTFYRSSDLGDSWVTYESEYQFFFLCPHARSAGVLFAGDVNQGILKSTDSGRSWQEANQGIRANEVYASAAGPGDAIAAATRSGTFLKRSGGPWEQVHSWQAYSVALHPTDGGTIFVGSDWCLVKTTDSGSSWGWVLIPSNQQNLVAAIALDPQNPETIYIGVLYNSGTLGEIYKSTDGGESLQLVESFEVPVNALAINPQNPRTIYAGTGMFYTPGAPGGVYKSTDGGANWTTLKTGVTVNEIALDPQDPNTIYLACGAGAGDYGGLFKSSDGGTTWQEKDFGIPADSAITDVAVAPDNRNIVFAATDHSGVYTSADGGNYWTRLGLSDYWLYDVLVTLSGASAAKLKGNRSELIDSSSDLYAGSTSGMLGYTGSGLGVIGGMVRALGSTTGIDSATLTTDTGGIALSLAGNYLMVAPAGQCTVNASVDRYQGAVRSGVIVPSGAQVTVDLDLMPRGNLYFPHIASNSLWETEVAIVNPSAGQTITGTLRPFGDSGSQASATVPVTLAPHARREITISRAFANPDTIGSILFESDADSVKGYTKFYRSGLFRAAIPATGGLNYGDVYLTHVTSDPNWWTGVSVLNTGSQAKNLRFEFNNGTTISRSIAANEHQKFLVSDLFGGQTPAGISSAVVTNASGVIGLELFSSANQMEGIPVSDETATTLYYPHLPSDSTWWTGIVTYNPSASACTLTITPYRTEGTMLTPITRSLAGKEKLSVLASGLGLPADTGWVEINATSAITGFALIGTADWNQVGGFYGIGAKKKEGVFAKAERSGGWSYLSMVNTEASAAQVTLIAYNDTGAQVATTTFTLSAHAKAENTAEGFFPNQSISTATYFAYSSDKDLVGLQLNRSADQTMLDGLPGL
jgi:photosystem II stability/assembly factor-like uncharacterized protein